METREHDGSSDRPGHSRDDLFAALSRLLDEALELTPAARAVWLERLRADRPQLAGEVEALLAAEADLDLSRFLMLQGVFPPQVVDEVTEFMKALTDPTARNLRRLVPQRVPSGLPVDDA